MIAASGPGTRAEGVAGGAPTFGAEGMMTERADFRKFYREAHAVNNLSEREKMFMGLAVAFARNCQY